MPARFPAYRQNGSRVEETRYRTYVCEEYDTAITLYLEAYELLNAIYRKTGECGEELGSVALCLSETFADTGKARKARKYYDIALKFGAIEEDERRITTMTKTASVKKAMRQTKLER